MSSEHILNLINRAKALDLDGPLFPEEIVKVEKELGVILSEDFKELSNNYSYEFLNLFEFFNFRRNAENSLIAETKYYRENHSLQHNYLVLFSDDVSFVLLKTISTENSEVIWCDYQDFFNLCDGISFQYNPTIFPTFTDFYEFLLDEEEKSRAEDEEN